MQLVAMGAQDVYLTGNPQITFFKVVYRRHTNFSKECIEQTFNGSVALGNTLNCTLSRNGDLIQEIYLKVEVTSDDGKTVTAKNLTHLIEHVEVEIGGQKIDKHYSQWFDIYNELFESNNKSREAMATPVLGTGVPAVDKTSCFVPLRFWFNRNPGLALPLIALQYHEVKINLKVASTLTEGTLNSATLLVNYLYLDTDERRRFAQVSHEYLIEQVQHTGKETKAKVTMNFNHPVKALFWRADFAAATDTVLLQLNGHDRAAAQVHAYSQLVQPYECGLPADPTIAQTRAVANDVYTGMYSFCLKPAEHQPSGTCNFSRIDNAVLNLGALGSTNSGEAFVFALNYNVLRIMSGMGGLAYSN